MQTKTVCSICERDIESLSPDMEYQRKLSEMMNLDGPSNADAIVTYDDGTKAHEQCEESRELLSHTAWAELGISLLKKGKSWSEIMSATHGLDSPPANSLRLVRTAYKAMSDFDHYFREEMSQRNYRIDLNQQPIEDFMFVSFLNSFAQVTISYSLIMWNAAHQPGNPKKDDVGMYLNKSHYTGDWGNEYSHFKEKRNWSVAHATNSFWDKQIVPDTYEPYPDFADDWKRLRDLL